MLEYCYKKYIKSVIISFSVLCLLYLYMLSNFWWGNHDWGYLLSGASFKSGLFEARYSLHLFIDFILDKHILPIFTFFCVFICICLLGIIIGRYFNIAQKYWVILCLFIGVNSHIFVIFYYLHYSFSLVVWGLVGVCLLFLSERKHSFVKFLFGSVGFSLILGSYPPNLAFIFVIFVAKRIFDYVDEKQNIKQNIFSFLFLGGQILVAGCCFKIIFSYLINNRFINDYMYNIKTRDILDIIKSLPNEILNSIFQLFQCFSFMEYGYILPLSILVLVACFIVYKKSSSKCWIIFLLISLFLASRFAFILSEGSGIAVFRLMYWGRLGLYIFAISVLMKQKDIWIKNLLFLLLIVFFFNNIVANFEIQKVQNLGFLSGRLYQKRLLETVVKNNNYDKDVEYISLNFGQPNFRKRFYNDKYMTGELIGYEMVFNFDVANYLFWEENRNQVIIGGRIDGASLLMVNRDEGNEKWQNGTYWKNNLENMKNIRYWLYTKAKPYPSDDAVYIDDKYMLLVLDPLIFYKKRELVINNLDK